MSNYYQKLSENIFKRMYSAFKNKLGSMRLEPPHPMDNAFTSAYHRKRDADPPSLQDIHPALGTDAKPKSGPKESPFWTNNPARARFKDAYRKKAAGIGRVPNPNYKEKEQAVEGTIMDYRTSIRALFEAVVIEGLKTGSSPTHTGAFIAQAMNKYQGVYSPEKMNKKRQQVRRIKDRVADRQVDIHLAGRRASRARGTDAMIPGQGWETPREIVRQDAKDAFWDSYQKNRKRNP